MQSVHISSFISAPVPAYHEPAPAYKPAPAPAYKPAPAPAYKPAPAPAYKPAPAYHEPEYHAVPAKYAYEYSVKDEYSATNFGHSEQRDGYKTSGEYRVALPDGRVQIVTYTADENGYVADVKYEGEAVYPKYEPKPYHPAPKPAYHEPKPAYHEPKPTPAYKPAPTPAYTPAPAPTYKPAPEPAPAAGAYYYF